MTGKRFIKRKGNSGFTLIEVLIALVILAIGGLGMLMLQVSSIQGNVSSRELQAATLLCQDLLERFEGLDYNDALLDAGQHSNDELGVQNPINESGSQGAGAIYSRTWVVAVDNPAQGMKTITVTVTWTRNSVPHSVQLTMIKARQ